MASPFGISVWRRVFLLSAAVLSVLPALYLPGARAHAKDGYPARIVSCGPAITEKLYLLGVDDRIAGVTTYCRRPSQALGKPKIGSVTHISMEKLISLEPDLVIATSLTDPRVVRKARKLGIKVAIFNSPGSYTEMNEQFVALGKMVGREQKATEIVRTSERRVREIREKTSALTKKKVFLQIGSSPLFTASRDSFLNDFLVFAGAVNVAADAGIGYYNREQVLRDDPDVILIVAMEGPVAHREKSAWMKFNTLRAARNNAIYVMDSDIMCSPTPLTFVEALEEVVRLVHGDKNKVGK